MIHPNTETRFINEEIGYGVVATSLIKKGTITWVLDELDREFNLYEVANMDTVYKKILDKYSFRNNKGNYVLCWDHAKFVNHSFKSNCLTTAYDFEIAIRDIFPGEQITDDYGYLNVTEPFEAFDEGTDRKIVYSDDVLKYSNLWDDEIKSAFKETVKLEQPLRSFIPNYLWQKILNITNDIEPMESIASCYYNPNIHKN